MLVQIPKNICKKGSTSVPILDKINSVIGIIFFACYFYQIVYLFIAYLTKDKEPPKTEKLAKIAVLIAARNEERVVGNLVDTLLMQDYKKDAYRVFLVADNCTDNTAAVAKEHGATVYERRNCKERGKGYALDFLIKNIWQDFGHGEFDGFLVFDADNLAEPDFLTEINKTFALGYDVVSSYRNSKNYAQSWLAAGQGMWFIRDARILNKARMKIGSCTFVSGTGFLFSRALCEKNGGWPFHTLTEDGEFTSANAVGRVKTGYCGTAEFYDEQPVTLSESWKQRLRWCKGGLQIFRLYLGKLLLGIFKRGGLACFDIAMCLAPAYLISVVAVLVNLVGFALMPFFGTYAGFFVSLSKIAIGVFGAYAMLFIFSLAATVSEWKKLHAGAFKKILYTFTFPLFIFSFIPIALAALFKRVEWTAIAHNDTATLSDLHGGKDKND